MVTKEKSIDHSQFKGKNKAQPRMGVVLFLFILRGEESLRKLEELFSQENNEA